MSGLTIVTAGTRGLGSAVSERCAAQGERGVAGYVSNEPECFTAAMSVPTICSDVANSDTYQPAVKTIVAKQSASEALISGAGIIRDGSFANMAAEGWNAVSVNLNGAFDTDIVLSVPHDIHKRIVDFIPTRRLAKSGVLADAIALLVHRSIGYVTGTSLSVIEDQYIR